MDQGFTSSESYLLSLARKSFLRFWSWPNLFRDQKAKGGTDGKELCDLLVVFGKDVLIFSDKLCEFPDSGDVQLDWSRWYKRAIYKSAAQAAGAKRWLEQFPNRVFIDAACQTRLPIDIPLYEVRFHLIVVAHGSGKRCQSFFNDSASLMINTRIVGDAHMAPREQVSPFTVGLVNESEPFIHVLDDSSLDILLDYLDTAGDFVEYLKARERFLGTKAVVAVGEEELLGFYLSKLENGKRDFYVPDEANAVLVDRGHWQGFITSASYAAKRQADEVSYTWDALIDTITDSIFKGRSYFPSDRTISDQEQCLRILASERRTWRRALAQSILTIIERANQQKLSARVIGEDKTTDGTTAYVFLALMFPSDVDLDTYRRARIARLEEYCMVAKLLLPKAKRIVGIATEHGSYRGSRSEDLMLLDVEKWTPEDEKEAIRLQQEENILKNYAKFGGTFKEFPVDEMRKQKQKSRRNQPCPCGSGKKYKKCHGK